MGLFHCPMGAAFYDDDVCIDCGMCTAKTKDDRVEASKKIRECLKAHAARNITIKKIAVCGKGGVGKSTIVALMANALKDLGYSVLVLDADESNPGLSRLLGLQKQPEALMTALVGSSSGGKDAEWLKSEQISFKDIPAEFIDGDNLKFLMVGKIEDPFQGCACSLASLARDLMGKLIVQDKEIVITDTEAGIESFGRGVEQYVDMVVVIVEPSYESVVLAEKIVYMAEGMGISHVGAILNKIPSEQTSQKMTMELEKRGVKLFGTIYLDPDLSAAAFEGTPLGNSKASEDVRSIVKRLLAIGGAC